MARVNDRIEVSWETSHEYPKLFAGSGTIAIGGLTTGTFLAFAGMGAVDVGLLFPATALLMGLISVGA